MPLANAGDPQRAVLDDAVAFDAAHEGRQRNRHRRGVRRQAGAAVHADRVVAEERVDPGVGRQPHLLEAVDNVGRELADAEVEEIFGTERRIESHVRVLELHGDAAVRVLGERHFSEIGHVVAERAGAEDVHLLRELEVVADAGDRAVFVDSEDVLTSASLTLTASGTELEISPGQIASGHSRLYAGAPRLTGFSLTMSSVSAGIR